MTLENRYACSPNEARQFGTSQLREHFLVSELMSPGNIKGVYSHYDRMVVTWALPHPPFDPFAQLYRIHQARSFFGSP